MRAMRTILAGLLLAAFAGNAVAAEDALARAQFTTDIDGREPVDAVQRLTTGHDRVYFFTELRGLEGRAVTHRWMHDGNVEATVDFEVGGPRWRVWSSKDLLPQWTGAWTVVVVDDTGERLGLETFIYAEQPAGDGG